MNDRLLISSVIGALSVRNWVDLLKDGKSYRQQKPDTPLATFLRLGPGNSADPTAILAFLPDQACAVT